MMYGQMPLYPALGDGCGGDACVRVPLFGEGPRAARSLPPVGDVRRIVLENPCCPGEWAEVILGVDACGNLALCVRRDDGCGRSRPPCPPADGCRPAPAKCPPPDCRPWPPCPPPRPRCRKGRLYGDWDNP